MNLSFRRASAEVSSEIFYALLATESSQVVKLVKPGVRHNNVYPKIMQKD